jgi:hypothetical protein
MNVLRSDPLNRTATSSTCTAVVELQSGEEDLRCWGGGLACPARVPVAAPGS